MIELDYPPSIRVFPNSSSLIFDSEEDFEFFLEEDLPYREVPGQYYFMSYSRLKNIQPSTLVLFRYLDMIKGVAIVEKSAVYSPKKDGKITYDGYIVLRDIQPLKDPLSIEELENITGTLFHQKGRGFRTGGRAYQIVPELRINVLVNRLNDLLKDEFHDDEEKQDHRENSSFSGADQELGRLGEEFILALERNKLKNSSRDPEKVRIGKGYDIKSWDENGHEIHIEVKTTAGLLEDRIFWTRREHFRSRKDSFYWIYRVYEFDRETKTGKIEKIKGSFLQFFESHPSGFFWLLQS